MDEEKIFPEPLALLSNMNMDSKTTAIINCFCESVTKVNDFSHMTIVVNIRRYLFCSSLSQNIVTRFGTGFYNYCANKDTCIMLL